MKIKFMLLILCLLVFSLSFLSLFIVNRHRLSDTAVFAGDTWEYQSLAVNLSLGHDYQIGGIEDFATYKFYENEDLRNVTYYHLPNNASSKKTDTLYSHFIEGGEYSFYRTPGYPFFLAIVYKLFGIHPRIVKIIQIILLAISASLMPIIGMYYWSRLGVLSGLISSFIFIRYYSTGPANILTETLLGFCLFVLVVLLMFWRMKPSSPIRTFLLGIMSAISILVKGSTAFVPMFLLLYIIFKFSKITKLKLSFIFILGFFLCMLPWSVYATKKNGSFLLLSTQANILLLDCNNEDNLSIGDWAPAWRKWNAGDPKYLYNSLGNSGYSPLKKILMFMSQNKKDVPILLKNKLYQCFCDRRIYPIIIGMFLYYLINVLSIKFKVNINEKIPIFPLIYFFNIFFIVLIFCVRFRFILPFMPFFILPAVYFPFKVLKLYILYRLSITSAGKQ